MAGIVDTVKGWFGMSNASTPTNTTSMNSSVAETVAMKEKEERNAISSPVATVGGRRRHRVRKTRKTQKKSQRHRSRKH
jgi:hypothetical protein